MRCPQCGHDNAAGRGAGTGSVSTSRRVPAARLARRARGPRPMEDARSGAGAPPPELCARTALDPQLPGICQSSASQQSTDRRGGGKGEKRPEKTMSVDHGATGHRGVYAGRCADLSRSYSPRWLSTQPLGPRPKFRRRCGLALFASFIGVLPTNAP